MNDFTGFGTVKNLPTGDNRGTLIHRTVTAHDEFDRLFNYTVVEDPHLWTAAIYPESITTWQMEVAVKSILEKMGTEAWAEWETIVWTVDI